jgi:NAD(P)-dependent dehydrogenase (short-subunit alcohol dehydrogenase family)
MPGSSRTTVITYDAQRLIPTSVTNGAAVVFIGRFADPDEIANLVVYAGSAAVSATTGAALRIDGGVVRSIV